MFGGVQGLNMSYQFGNNYNVCNKSKKCLIIKDPKKKQKCIQKYCKTQWLPNTTLGAVG